MMGDTLESKHSCLEEVWTFLQWFASTVLKRATQEDESCTLED